MKLKTLVPDITWVNPMGPIQGIAPFLYVHIWDLLHWLFWISHATGLIGTDAIMMGQMELGASHLISLTLGT